MQKRRVNVVGSANMDLVVRTARFPLPGETLLGGEFATFPGGKGANQAVAIGRLGGNPLFIGKVGGDAFGQDLMLSLDRSGVDVGEVIVDEQHATGIALITVDGSGENSIIVASGANMALAPEEVRSILEQNPASVLLAQLEVPLETVLAASEAHTGIFVLNPAPAAELPDELLRRVDVITPNQHEAALITGVTGVDDGSLREAAESLHQRGVKHVVITLGADGCFWGTEGHGERFAAHELDAVDTTAAGDAFSGGLAHALSRGQDMPHAIRFAAAVAGLSTTRLGAQASMPTWQEVESFIG